MELTTRAAIQRWTDSMSHCLNMKKTAAFQWQKQQQKKNDSFETSIDEFRMVLGG